MFWAVLTSGAAASIGLSFFAIESTTTIFRWHVVLMSIGTLLLGASAISLMRGEGIFISSLSRPVRGQVHGIMQSLGLVCIILGMVAIYRSKELNGKPHLTSYHSWIGVAAFVWLLMNTFGGAASSIDVKRKRLFYGWADKTHRLSGYGAITAGIIAVVTGIYSHWGAKNLGPRIQGAFTMLCFLIWASLMLPLVKKTPKRGNKLV